MSHYEHASGADDAPLDFVDGDSDIDFDSYEPHDFMDHSGEAPNDHEHDYLDEVVPDSVPSSGAFSSPAQGILDSFHESSNLSGEEDEDELFEHDLSQAASAAPSSLSEGEDHDGGYDASGLHESIFAAHAEQEQDQNTDINGEAYHLHSQDHDGRGRRNHSSDVTRADSSLASIDYLDEPALNRAATDSPSTDSSAPSPYAASRYPVSEDSSRSESDSSLDSDSRSGSDSGSISVSDSDPESGSAEASPQSSGSGSSTASAARQGLGDPHFRGNPSRRPAAHIDITSPSPRLSSLTPTIHPNRRLPQTYAQGQNQPGRNRTRAQTLSSTGSSSGLSSDESAPRTDQSRHRRSAPSQDEGLFRVSLLSSDEYDTADDTEDDTEDGSVQALGGEQNQVAGGAVPEVIVLDRGQDSPISDVRNSEGYIQHLGRLEGIAPQLAHSAATSTREGDRLPQAERAGPNAGQGSRLRSPSLEELEAELEAEMDLDDELVEVVWDRQLNARRSTPPQHQANRRPRAHNHNNQQAGGVDVIDLTEEPDSPVQRPHRPLRVNRIPYNQDHDHHDLNQAGPRAQNRNPRRHMSQNGRTPSLARSDGSILGHAPAVIDLTGDGPDEAVRGDERAVNADGQREGFHNIPANRRLPAPVPGPQRNHRRSVEIFGNFGGLGRNILGIGNLGIRGLLPGLLAHIGQPHDQDIQIIGDQHAFHMNPDPLAGNPPEFNYQANGFGGFGGRQPTPKPDFEAPPAARPGFTRSTGMDEETNEQLVAVCASCDNELKYSAVDDDDGPRPAKRPRNKKDREEHHFWAVKACGHVYCKSCYDNRKKTKNVEDMGFRVVASGTSKSSKIFCAVDDCESDVTLTGAWVGIFM